MAKRLLIVLFILILGGMGVFYIYNLENPNTPDQGGIDQGMTNDNENQEEQLQPEFYGALAVDQGTTYTVPEMLIYALEDEWLAYAQYAEVINVFGDVFPFVSIMNGEQGHVDALLPLFKAYNVEVPANIAIDYVSVPKTIEEAFQLGVDAEKNNVAMYEQFMNQGLPEDVEKVFTALMDSSNVHLNSFESQLNQ